MTGVSQWLHGLLDPCLLALIDEDEDYGFGLARRLVQVGLGEVPGGTLYPALLRLERQGWVSVRWLPSDSGPRRKYYRLTAAGQEMLTADAEEWRRFRDSVDRVLDAGTPAAPARERPDRGAGRSAGPRREDER